MSLINSVVKFLIYQPMQIISCKSHFIAFDRRSLIRRIQKILKMQRERLGSKISWKFINTIYWLLQDIIVTHYGIITLPISALDNICAKWFVINNITIILYKFSSSFDRSKSLNFNSLNLCLSLFSSLSLIIKHF